MKNPVLIGKDMAKFNSFQIISFPFLIFSIMYMYSKT